ncbi:MAG TPA: NUDIX hydrolase [Candidatus Omnitrophota bacterium]|nr:NUDIX hydrolase [Candidatus Omnitrophota bacterium]
MKKLSEKILFQGKWISIREVHFLNPRHQEVAWETIVRNEQKSSVIVVPILMPSRRIVLIKQYRLPLEDWVIGFPAGMTDGNPDQAFHELKEETGYIGEVAEESPALQINSGLLNETTKIVVMHINEHDPVNQNPCQSLEPTEEIEVLLVPYKEVRTFLLEQNSKGVRIAAGVWSVFGLQLHLG